MALVKTVADSYGSMLSQSDGSSPVVVGEGMMDIVVQHLIKLYSNPKQATVREVISNAMDATVAHVNAGGEHKLVRVTTPSSTCPKFVVEDFGTGMDADTAVNVFSNLSASEEKSSDVSQIGSHGLGAKAPLSYAREFSVRTTKDGITTSMTLFRGDSGFRKTNPVIEVTGEDSGTVVEVPVDFDDISDFVDYIGNYARNGFASPIVIDNEIRDSIVDNEFVEVGELVVEHETGTKGRVWAKTSRTNFSNRYGVRFSYILSGYEYDSRNSSTSSSDIVVEIFPGIVNFNTSRDSIVDDGRLSALDGLVQSQIDDDFLSEVIRKIVESGSLSDSQMREFSKAVELYVNSSRKVLSFVNESVDVDVEKAVTISGKKPFASLADMAKVNVIGLLRIYSKVRHYGRGCHIAYYDNRHGEGTRYPGKLNNEKFPVALAKQKLVSNFHSGVSAGNVLLGANDNKVIVVGVAGEKELSRVFARRATFETAYGNATLIPVRAETMPDIETVRRAFFNVRTDTAAEIAETVLVFANPKDAISAASEITKESFGPVRAKPDSVARITEIDLTSGVMSWFSNFGVDEKFRGGEHKSVRPEELKNAVLVTNFANYISGMSVASALLGYESEGNSLHGKSVYAVSGKPVASFFLGLGEDVEIIAPKSSASHRSDKVNDLVKKFHKDVSAELASGYDEDEIITELLLRIRAGAAFESLIKKIDNSLKVYSGSDELSNFTGFKNFFEKYFSGEHERIPRAVSSEQLRSSISPRSLEQAGVMHLVALASGNWRYFKSMADNITLFGHLYGVVTTHSKISTELTNSAVEHMNKVLGEFASKATEEEEIKILL